MLNTLGRSLNLCFTKIKASNESQPSISKDRSRLSEAPKPTNAAAATSLFIKTFNSLFDQPSLSSPGSSSDTDTDTDPTPDFATAIASRRFFFSSPGRSNSIIDSTSPSLSSPSSSATSPQEEKKIVVGGGVAIPTYSPDPYRDFRQSMEEMVESRGMHDVRENWEQLHELLTCYLALNPKCTHKFILAAFADLLVSLVGQRSKT